uniref:Uncharacterized protein n=1 Tax=Metarhizium album TaxID=92629 RepID=A0A891GZC2_9HYPO|nr:hypothetical protein K8J96_mgp04 [Metarhizium album]QRK27496.1 hypothetical protein [Metarhizium album]
MMFLNSDLNSLMLILLTFILYLNIVLFYLDDFRLSQNKYLKFLQVLTPAWLIFFILLLLNNSIFVVDNAILHIDDKNVNNTISIGGSIEVTKDAAESLGRNIGTAGTIAGVSGAVAKVIGKSSMPPIQKAGVVLASASIAGAIHVATTTYNKIINNNISNLNANSPVDSSVSFTGNSLNFEGPNKLIADGLKDLSDLKLLLLSMNTLASASLVLVLILFIMISLKLYLNEDKIKFNNFLGNKVNAYLIKLIQYNKKTSTIWIFIIFAVLIISLSYECYFITGLYDNLDKFIYFHQNR